MSNYTFLSEFPVVRISRGRSDLVWIIRKDSTVANLSEEVLCTKYGQDLLPLLDNLELLEMIYPEIVGVPDRIEQVFLDNGFSSSYEAIFYIYSNGNWG